MRSDAVLAGRLTGKTVLIHGRYGYGEKEQLVALAQGRRRDLPKT